MQSLTILDKMKFFEGLTEEEKSALSTIHLRVFKYDAGTVIIKADGDDHNLYIIIKGTATVMGTDKDPLAILKPGEVFGEIAFLVPRPRSASVVANTEVIAMRVDREGFKTLSTSLREKLKDKLIRIIVDRLTTHKKPEDLSLSNSFDWTH
ncbi:MAG: cyclic nucleotide-binding domain-containing protein [Magnetococcales bacterium]|nr:cyclic nucleotide-binding domain-containing protein [Magnetococcales bacterium]